MYKVSVWVQEDFDDPLDDAYKYTKLKYTSGGQEFTVGINPNESVLTNGQWAQVNFYVNLSEGDTNLYITNSDNLKYDDFRMHPVESSMTSYVYNQWDELTYILGPNNMGTKYEYDAAGRLTKTSVEVAKNATTNGGFKETSNTEYYYYNN